MKKIITGVMTALVTAAMLLFLPNYCMAVAQAPAQSVLFDNAVTTDEVNGVLELLPNPVLKENQKEETYIQAFAGEASQNRKIESLVQSRQKRIQEEKIRAEKLRLKRLAEKRARQEAKRRREIQACCGVAVGSEDQQILERIVEAEAGGESFQGRLLVANVILNRVKSKSFPKTIKGVVFAHRGSRYQFSPIPDGRYYSVSVSKDTKSAVKAALRGKDPSKGALYFMERSSAARSNVSWFDRALTRLFRYGCHEFYK